MSPSGQRVFGIMTPHGSRASQGLALLTSPAPALFFQPLPPLADQCPPLWLRLLQSTLHPSLVGLSHDPGLLMLFVLLKTLPWLPTALGMNPRLSPVSAKSLIRPRRPSIQPHGALWVGGSKCSG